MNSQSHSSANIPEHHTQQCRNIAHYIADCFGFTRVESAESLSENFTLAGGREVTADKVTDFVNILSAKLHSKIERDYYGSNAYSKNSERSERTQVLSLRSDLKTGNMPEVVLQALEESDLALPCDRGGNITFPDRLSFDRQIIAFSNGQTVIESGLGHQPLPQHKTYPGTCGLDQIGGQP